MYSENNKVFWYNNITQKFHLLYDFSANKGDSWYVFPQKQPVDSFLVTVDSVKSIIINGNSLKVLYISNIGNPWIFDGGIIEKIGLSISSTTSLGYMFPIYGLCENDIGPLRCYSDTIIGFFQASINIPCDTTYVTSTEDKKNINNNFLIYPNPFKDNIFIRNCLQDNSCTFYQYKITNILGIIIKQGLCNNNETPINVSLLPEGIYFIELNINNKKFSIQKVIKF